MKDNTIAVLRHIGFKEVGDDPAWQGGSPACLILETDKAAFLYDPDTREFQIYNDDPRYEGFLGFQQYHPEKNV